MVSPTDRWARRSVCIPTNRFANLVVKSVVVVKLDGTYTLGARGRALPHVPRLLLRARIVEFPPI